MDRWVKMGSFKKNIQGNANLILTTKQMRLQVFRVSKTNYKRNVNMTTAIPDA